MEIRFAHKTNISKHGKGGGEMGVISSRFLLPAVSGATTGFIIRQNGSVPVVVAPGVFAHPDFRDRQLSSIVRANSGSSTGVGPFPIDQYSQEHWNVGTGDLVTWTLEPPINGSSVYSARIHSVWGERNAEVVNGRKPYASIMHSDHIAYPQIAVELDVPELFAGQLLAPIGLGAAGIAGGDSGSGKTRMAQEYLAAMMDWAEAHPELKIAFVICQVGERPMDGAKTSELIAKHPNLPIFHFKPPHGASGRYEPMNNLLLAQGVIERLFELGWHVISVNDSLRGFVSAFTADQSSKDGGMSGAGVPTGALLLAQQFMAHAGLDTLGGGSITNIVTALTTGGQKSQAEQMRMEVVAELTFILEVMLSGEAGLAYPKLRPSRMMSRSPDVLFRDNPDRLELHESVWTWVRSMFEYDRIGNVNNDTKVLAELQAFAETGKSWRESVSHWLHILRTKQFAVSKPIADKRWEALVGNLHSLGNLSPQLQKMVCGILSKLWRVNVEIITDESPKPVLLADDGVDIPPQPARVVSVEEVKADINASVLVEKDGVEYVEAGATTDQILAKWEELFAKNVTRTRPARFRAKKFAQDGTTLEEFELEVRAGRV